MSSATPSSSASGASSADADVGGDGAPERPGGALGGVALPAPASSLVAVVVVPARDEEHSIDACLDSLADQEGVDPAGYEVILVLDGCEDETESRASSSRHRHPGLTLHLIRLDRSQGVGNARRIGMQLACERLSSVGRGDGLILSTDADTVVAPDWLAVQLALIGAGAKAIGGRIELDADQARSLGEEVIQQRREAAAVRLEIARGDDRQQGSVFEHHQFSGASLALTVEAYLQCGGMPVSAALEDEALERRLTGRGIPIHRSDAVRVWTSARTTGRAPRGLAYDLNTATWRARRSFAGEQFPLARLLAAKRESVAVVLPAREVAGSIAQIASCVIALRDAGLVDEAVLVDACSQDGTPEIALQAGLTVVQESELAIDCGPARGKGDAMWRALGVVQSEIVAFVDADTEDFHTGFITGLLGPLICEDSEIQLVKGSFQRPFRDGPVFRPGEGGRVTELMARPLLNLHAPELAVFDQPLAGEVAARRELLERLPFCVGYGVEIAMLIDAWRMVGLNGLAQVDLGVRQNRHQSLRELSAMAYAVLVAASTRFLGEDLAGCAARASIALPPLSGGGAMQSRQVPIEERPPWRERVGGREGVL